MWYKFFLFQGKWWNSGNYVMSHTQPTSTNPDEKFVYWKDC